MSANVWAVAGGVVGYIPVTALTGTADQLFGMNGAGTLATWKNAKYKDSSGQLYVPAGAVGTPSYSWAGSLTSGFYLTGADSIGIAIAGVNAATLDAAKLALVKHLQLTGKLVMEDKGADIACAATTDLGNATGNFLTLTNAAGATNIASLGGDTIPAGTEIEGVMNITGGSVTFVHNATDLICLGGANVPCQDKDIIRWRKINDAAAKWQMVGLQRGITTGILTNAGDLLVGLGSGNSSRFAVGAEGYQLFGNADPSEKMSWAPAYVGFNIINGYLEWSVAANALTIALKGWNGADPSASNPVFVIFRDPAVANANQVIRKVNAALSLVISSGSTLGARNNIPFRIWAGLVDDAGTIRLAAINCVTTIAGAGTGSDVTGITSLNGWQIISSTAEGGAGAADSAQTFYTGVAVAGKAFVPVGYATWEAGLAAVGTWGTAPSRKQLWQVGSPLAGQPTGNKARVDTGIVATGSTVLPADNTIPQNTEGDQYMSLAITPSSAANILESTNQAVVSNSAITNDMSVALFRDAIANGLRAADNTESNAAFRHSINIFALILSEGSVSTTFKLRAGVGGAATLTFNGSGGGQLFGGVMNSFMDLKEIMG